MAMRRTNVRRRPPGRSRFYARRKFCAFCVDHVKKITYMDVVKMRRFLTDWAKIEPRRKTGTCAKHQRFLSRALKRARALALLPMTTEHALITGWTGPRGLAPPRPAPPVVDEAEATAEAAGPSEEVVAAEEAEAPTEELEAAPEPEAAAEEVVVAEEAEAPTEEVEVAAEPEAVVEEVVAAEEAEAAPEPEGAAEEVVAVEEAEAPTEELEAAPEPVPPDEPVEPGESAAPAEAVDTAEAAAPTTEDESASKQ